MQHACICVILAHFSLFKSEMHAMPYLYNEMEYLDEFTKINSKELENIMVKIVREFSEIFRRIFFFFWISENFLKKLHHWIWINIQQEGHSPYKFRECLKHVDSSVSYWIPPHVCFISWCRCETAHLGSGCIHSSIYTYSTHTSHTRHLEAQVFCEPEFVCVNCGWRL